MKQHFRVVCSDGKFVEKAFLKVQKFLKHFKLEEWECYDLATYTLTEASLLGGYMDLAITSGIMPFFIIKKMNPSNPK
jgi:hypothetical protein